MEKEPPAGSLLRFLPGDNGGLVIEEDGGRGEGAGLEDACSSYITPNGVRLRIA
jgi:hypothetical protein